VKRTLSRYSQFACILAVCISCAPHADAQPYPTRSIRIVVPFTPGTGIDILARVAGQKLNERWSQVVVVDNGTASHGWPGGIVTRFEIEGWASATVDGRDHDVLEAALGATVIDCTTPLPGWYGSVCVVGVGAAGAVAGLAVVVGLLLQPASTRTATAAMGRTVRIIGTS